MTLQELWNALLKKKVIKPSRVRSIACSLKHYAKILGYPDPSCCPESAYNLASRTRKALIDEKAACALRADGGSAPLSDSTIANIKSEVSLVLKVGASLGLIRARLDVPGRRATAAGPINKYPKLRMQWRRGDTNALPPVAIPEAQLPAGLREELDEYYRWATDPFVPDRPPRRKRRKISADCDREILRCIAGFLVKHCGAAPEGLTLLSLTDVDAVAKYIKWFIRHHGRATKTLKQVLISQQSLAKYLGIKARTKEEQAAMYAVAESIKDLITKLPPCLKVRDKKKCWLPLEEIEICGINRYPRTELRLAAASPAVRQKLQTLNTEGCHGKLKTTAVYAMESLYIRLLVRIPLRDRNFCEMCWNPYVPEEGKNLFRHDGTWYVRFSGEELKIGEREDEVNFVLHRIPKSLNWLLEEVLTIWRPIITGVPYSLPRPGESVSASYREPIETRAPKYKEAPRDVRLFLTARCKPVENDTLRFWLGSLTYGYAGVAVYPHLVRTIWATTYIKKNKDFPGATKRLGNTVRTTLKDYSELLDEEAEMNGDDFNRLIFNDDEENES